LLHFSLNRLLAWIRNYTETCGITGPAFGGYNFLQPITSK
jgi:hypothetical protein